MKRTAHRFLVTAALIALLASITACQNNPATSPGGQANSAPASGETSAAMASENAEISSPDSSQASETTAAQEVECNWTLDVSDTETAKINGYDFECTLSVLAVKAGGKDETGIYNGTVKLEYTYKMTNGGIGGNAEGSGQDLNAVFEVILYDAEQYADSSGTSDLAPVVSYDAMALGSLNLTGSGLSEESAGGGSWTTADSKTLPAPYRMAVDGGQVIIELLSVAPGIQFKGTLTGEPVN